MLRLTARTQQTALCSKQPLLQHVAATSRPQQNNIKARHKRKISQQQACNNSINDMAHKRQRSTQSDAGIIGSGKYRHRNGVSWRNQQRSDGAGAIAEEIAWRQQQKTSMASASLERQKTRQQRSEIGK